MKKQITLHEAHNSALGKTIEKLSREKAALESQLADLRDFAYNRAPKIAAEEANVQKAEFEAQLAEANERADNWRRAFNIRCEQADERDGAISDQFTLLANAEREARKRAEQAEAQLAEANRERDKTIEQCNGHFDKWQNETKKAEAREGGLRAALDAILAEEQFELVQWSRDTRLKIIQAQADATQSDCDHLSCDVCDVDERDYAEI